MRRGRIHSDHCGVSALLLTARKVNASLLSQVILTASDLVENNVRRGFPNERSRVAVPVGQPLIDGLFQFVGAMERSSADHSPGDQSKEPFHLIQPGTAGRGEMEVESLALFRLQPTLDFGALVGAVVIHDQVHFLIGREILFEVIQESDELAAAMPLLAGTDDFAIQDVESSEQSCGAMAL